MNRSAKRLLLFTDDRDYADFETVLREAADHRPMRLLAYVLMPNHWHLLLWPVCDVDLSRYMQWVTMTHALRWHSRHGTVGTGAVYQGRFKAVPVQHDHHYLAVCRYIARNPVRARLAGNVEDWKWSSLSTERQASRPPLASPPVSHSSDWLLGLSEPQQACELQAIRACVRLGRPIGSPDWEAAAQRRLTLATRGRGRPVHATTSRN